MTKTRTREFLRFFPATGTRFVATRLLVLNADQAGSVDTPEINELSGSGVSQNFGECNRHNMKTITLKSFVLLSRRCRPLPNRFRTKRFEAA